MIDPTPEAVGAAQAAWGETLRDKADTLHASRGNVHLWLTSLEQRGQRRELCPPGQGEVIGEEWRAMIDEALK